MGGTTGTVLLARHGQASYESALVSNDGGSLTEAGRGQAHTLASQLAPLSISSIWTSSLSRGVQTAEIIGAELGLPVTVREGLREYSVGFMAGTAIDEAAHVSTTLADWLRGDDSSAIEGGESFMRVVQRVEQVLEEIVPVLGAGSALVVSHGGAILATVPWLTGARPLDRPELWMPNCGYFELQPGPVSGPRRISEVHATTTPRTANGSTHRKWSVRRDSPVPGRTAPE